MENLNAVIDKIKSLVDELSLQAHLGFKELEKEVEGLKKEKEASKEEWSDFIWDKVTDLVDGLSEKYKWEDIKVDKETTEDIKKKVSDLADELRGDLEDVKSELKSAWEEEGATLRDLAVLKAHLAKMELKDVTNELSHEAKEQARVLKIKLEKEIESVMNSEEVKSATKQFQDFVDSLSKKA